MGRRLQILIALLMPLAALAQWSAPVLVDTPWDSLGVNGPSRDWCPFVTADGEYLYFASWRGDGPGDLYVSRRTDNGWGSAQKLPFCTLDNDERNPSANATNDTLYFIRWEGNWDIFWVFRTGPCDTCWGTPERLPAPINSGGIEFSVWCTPDNQRLLFSSWRVHANGEDIYECRRDASTPTGWGEPQLLPGRLNTWTEESYPSLGLDTTEIFFWGRYDRLYAAELTDSGWTRGDSLPDYINRVIIRDPSEITPAITPDGRRLYFSSSWGDTAATAGDIWFTERPLDVPDARPAVPEGLCLSVYPNPFNSRTEIRFSLPVLSEVRLSVVDVLGRVVLARDLGRLAAGEQRHGLDGEGLASGVYFVRVVAGERGVVRKVALIR